jgi:hypothetical protein
MKQKMPTTIVLLAITSLTRLWAAPSLEAVAKKEWTQRPLPREEQLEEAAIHAKLASESESTIRSSYHEAVRRMHGERHDQVWWSQHYHWIELARGGYYYLDGGYWFPARGYDATNETYSFDGPIYAYDNLAPDQVITAVQARLVRGGYYAGAITGLLDPRTRTAIGNYQREHALPLTSAPDEATVKALRLADG